MPSLRVSGCRLNARIAEDSSLPALDLGDLSVAHVKDAIGDLSGFGIVGDHQDGLVELAAGCAEHVEDGVGVFRVEIAGGFIGEHDGWAGNEGSRNSNALLFAAGELIRTVLETALNPKKFREMVEQSAVEGLLLRGSDVGNIVSDFDVTEGGERRQQVETLEDETDFGAAHPSAFDVGETGEVDTVDEH